MAIFNRRRPEQAGAPADVPMLKMGAGGQMLPYQGGMRREPDEQTAPAQIMAPGGEMLRQPIGTEQVREAMQTLRKYKAGKANMERRIIEDEEWWKLRHWNFIPEQGTTQLKTKSAWLVNVILSKHADAMDAFPEPNCLPRAADDEEEARRLSSVLPVVLENSNFEDVWSDNWWKKLKAGTAIYGVFWDGKKLNGLGDISIRSVDPLNLFWEPGIRELQQSRNIFHVELWSNAALKEQYPDLEDKQLTKDIVTSKYLYDDNVDTSDKSPVVDWYYKKNEGGRNVLHYVKFVGETVLYATENEADMRGGLYDHGMYPFFADILFPEEGTPAGYGYIDICKDAQRQIDLMNNAIVANCVAAATPRWLKRGDDGINEAEYADWTKPFVHVQGSIDENVLKPVPVQMLSGNYITILQEKINEMKETSGNRDVNNGGSAAGVTAASAIAAMQEQSGKLSRDQIRQSYRCFRSICYCAIELIRQFYGEKRTFRITGPNGAPMFVPFDNSGLAPVPQGHGADNKDFGVDMGFRVPQFDIEVDAQKESPYTKITQNELALQFYNNGFFNPQMADQAAMCLAMMDFKGKDKIKQQVQQNGGLFRQMQMQIAQLEAMLGIQRDEAGNVISAPGGGGTARMPETENDKSQRRSNALIDKAKASAQASTQPR